jgi:hypothetical protein
MSDTNDPCEQERADLAAIDEPLAAARAEAQAARDILLNYQKIIHKGAPYTEANKEWIDELIADCRTEQDAYKHAPKDQFEAIDPARPLLSAGQRQGEALGKARDHIRDLLAKQKAAHKKLTDCETQHGALPTPDRLVCGQPRVGHGHENEPCHVHLGPDGLCQYHDIA